MQRREYPVRDRIRDARACGRECARRLCSGFCNIQIADFLLRLFVLFRFFVRLALLRRHLLDPLALLCLLLLSFEVFLSFLDHEIYSRLHLLRAACEHGSEFKISAVGRAIEYRAPDQPRNIADNRQGSRSRGEEVLAKYAHKALIVRYLFFFCLPCFRVFDRPIPVFLIVTLEAEREFQPGADERYEHDAIDNGTRKRHPYVHILVAMRIVFALKMRFENRIKLRVEERIERGEHLDGFIS